MGKDQDLLQAVRDHDVNSLQRMLCKQKGAAKNKPFGTAKKINVNFQDADGMTALHQSALTGEVDIMRMLIDGGALVDIKDKKGMRPLHYAAWQGKELGAISLLLENSSSANKAANDGMTPLHLACEHGHLNVVTQLLKHHGDPTAENNAYKTPLDLACEFGRVKVVELLIKSNQCISLLLGSTQDDMADNTRSTCLHLAARNGHSNIIRLLLQAGIDINRQTLQGTCLHEAALCGKIEAVRLLLDSGVDVNKTNSYDQTALDIVNKFTGNRAAKELKQLLKEASYVVQGRAIKDYVPTMHDPNHITLKEGDVLTVLEQHPSGMWKGYISRADGQVTKKGYFPASAVVLVDSLALTAQTPQLQSNGTGTLGRGGQFPQTPDHITKPTTLSPTPGAGDSNAYGTVGADGAFPPPPSHLAAPKNFSSTDSDRDSGISPQQSYPSQTFSQSSFPGRQPSPNSPAERTAEWIGRYVGEGGDNRCGSPNRDSPGNSNRNSTSSNNNGGYMPQGYVTASGQTATSTQHRLSGQSYESGVSGVSAASRHSYHSNSSSSLGSLDRLEESGYSSTVNVHELFQSGLTQDEVLRTWLADLHFDEYYDLFVPNGYDMPTISHMTPQDLTAVGISNPKHRKRLKAEINKLHIIDGFPEDKPAEIGEWLAALDLPQYLGCLTQECQTMDGVLDIEPEDLEDIGITKLGHQKKIQLGIERIKRVQSGGKRMSSLERKGSSELLDGSAYHNAKWLGVDKSKAAYWGDNSIRKSASGDNLYAAGLSNGPLELTTFQQPKDEEPHSRTSAQTDNHHGSMGQSWPSPNPMATGHVPPDIVAIHLNRANQRGGSMEPPPPYTFYETHRDSDTPVDGDATPTNERRRIPSTESSDGMATIRRPSAKVSPRIAPKPKPVATVVAKSKRISHESFGEVIMKPEMEDSTIEASSGSMAYSCSTLPRKFTTRGHSEHIYDKPAENHGSPMHGAFGLGQNSSPGSPAHLNHSPQYSASPWNKTNNNSRKAPPPPPKRTNSIKCNMNKVGKGPEIRVEDTSDSFVPSSPQITAQQPIQTQPKYSNSVSSLAKRFHSKQQADSGNLKQVLNQCPSSSDSDFPPPPPAISEHISSLASSGASSQSAVSQGAMSSPYTGSYGGDEFTYTSTESDNPLNDIIEQLEKSSHGYAPQQTTNATNSPASSHVAPPATSPKPAVKEKPVSKDMKLGDWQDGQVDSGDDSDSASESSRRRDPASGSETVGPSGGASDTNTLPFANENVGTIKQRNQASKPSIVSVSEVDDAEQGSSEHTSRNVDLNASIFDDGTGTVKRCPKSSTSGDAKRVPPPVATKKKDHSPVRGQGEPSVDESDDVLNDIDNMLQGLTDELDAMLELEMM